MKILKKIIYRGCLKDLCFYSLGLIVLLSPVIAKFIADFINKILKPKYQLMGGVSVHWTCLKISYNKLRGYYDL